MKERSAQVRWEQRTQRPLFGLAAAFALAYVVPIVWPEASSDVTRVCTVVEWAVWGAFALDYLVRLLLAERRALFVRTHWIDLCAVLLPLIQPLRLLRLVSTLLLVGQRARLASQIKLTTDDLTRPCDRRFPGLQCPPTGPSSVSDAIWDAGYGAWGCPLWGSAGPRAPVGAPRP